MAHKKLCKTLKILAGAAGIAFVGMQLVAKKKKADYTYKNEPAEQNPFEGKKVVFVKMTMMLKMQMESEDIWKSQVWFSQRNHYIVNMPRGH